MSDVFELHVEPRTTAGKAAARRLRSQQDRVPAVIYGAGKEPQSISVSHKEITHMFENEAAYSHILTLKFNDHAEKVVLKALQRHAFKPRINHADFLRVKATEKLLMSVPLHFVGEDSAPGLGQGGILSKLISDVEIRCLPSDLPEFIEVDVSALDMGHSIHLSELKLPKGVELVAQVDAEHDQAITSIHAPKAAAAEEAAPETEETAAKEGETEAKQDTSEE